MPNIDPIIGRLREPLFDLAGLLEGPRLRFSSLREKDVPENAGLYVIYKEEPFEALYVGKARRRDEPSNWGQPDGLCFRIMKNHLAYQGNDNFIRHLMGETKLPSKADVRDYVRKNCSVHWLEVADERRLFILEHLAIAAVQPRLNRG